MLQGPAPSYLAPNEGEGWAGPLGYLVFKQRRASSQGTALRHVPGGGGGARRTKKQSHTRGGKALKSLTAMSWWQLHLRDVINT